MEILEDDTYRCFWG
ncbi:TPA: hypothetical protein ACGVAZ_004518 [Vibrio vulnificus]